MTDKELRRLRRDDLLQILINQQRQNDELNAALKKAQEALDERRIAIEESGSVAEAALKLNGVFDAAQSAADQYLAQVREQADAELAKARLEAEDVLRNARTEAERILREARGEAVRQKTGAPKSEVTEPEPTPTHEDPQAEDAKPRRGLFGRNRKA